ncbi:uncharacterized protein LOC119633907 [Glossina fuscipes]|uniref:Uncharacterized protein LOC119633907 n=1 Tax=Glossina fuscipes TaxID=7396 RepID=A0A8U0WF03_9MUSC|nr:uncharacterized protein LOC119633907 [Glossina fuscipes]
MIIKIVQVALVVTMCRLIHTCYDQHNVLAYDAFSQVLSIGCQRLQHARTIRQARCIHNWSSVSLSCLFSCDNRDYIQFSDCTYVSIYDANLLPYCLDLRCRKAITKTRCRGFDASTLNPVNLEDKSERTMTKIDENNHETDETYET